VFIGVPIPLPAPAAIAASCVAGAGAAFIGVHIVIPILPSQKQLALGMALGVFWKPVMDAAGALISARLDAKKVSEATALVPQAKAAVDRIATAPTPAQREIETKAATKALESVREKMDEVKDRPAHEKLKEQVTELVNRAPEKEKGQLAQDAKVPVLLDPKTNAGAKVEIAPSSQPVSVEVTPGSKPVTVAVIQHH